MNDILKKNILIAQYLNFDFFKIAPVVKIPDRYTAILENADDIVISVFDLKFHKYWDWLMPAVKKINETMQVKGAKRDVLYTINVLLSSGYNMSDVPVSRLDFTVENLWNRTVQYIEYNKLVTIPNHLLKYFEK